MKRRLCILLTLLLIAGSFGGCGASDEELTELNIAVTSSPLSVDPQLIYDVGSATISSFFTAALFRYDTDHNLLPCLAESYDLSEDGLTYTFHLRENLKWSDGRPMTAEDFVFAFRRLADPDVGSNSVYLITDSCIIKNAVDVSMGKKPTNELGVSSPDRNTFIVELEEPCPYFCSLLTMTNFTPCNEDFFHSMGENYASSADKQLYSGAYIMDRYEPLAMQIHFIKNPYYPFADDITTESVNIRVAGNLQQALMCYEAGSIDITPISGELKELADGDPELQIFSRAAVNYFDINQRTNTALANKNIRMALSKSIDRGEITKNVLKSGFSPMTRMVPPGLFKDPDGTDFSADQDLYAEYAGYDPAEAEKLWKQGLSELGVSSVKLSIMYASSQMTLIEAISDQMKKALPGLELELRGVPAKELNQKHASGDYDLMLYGWVADYADPTSFLGLFSSGATTAGFNNAEFDEIYAKIQTGEVSKDAELRSGLMHEAEEVLMKNAGVIPIFTEGGTYLIRDNVTGFKLNPTGVGCIVTELKKEAE